MLIRIFLLLALALSACSTPQARVEAPRVPLVSVVSFEFVDGRPEGERRSHAASGSQSELFYGEDVLDPKLAETFKSALQDRLGNQLTGKTVVLTSSEVSLSSESVRATRPNGMVVVPSLGAALVAIPIVTWLNQAMGDPRETKNVYVRIEGTVSGRPFTAKMNEKYPGAVTPEDVQSTLRATAILATFEIKESL